MSHRILLLFLTTITISVSALSYASVLRPDLSPEAVGRLFTQAGFVTGAVRDIEGSRIRVKSIRVEAKDKWLIIHILPERIE